MLFLILFLVASIVVYFAALFFINGGFTKPGQPVLYRGWFPFLGTALEINTLGMSKFVETNSKLNGGIFSTHFFGMNSTFITDIDCFNGLWKDKNLKFQKVADKFQLRLFGNSPTKSNMTAEEIDDYASRQRALMQKYLQGDALSTLAKDYALFLEAKIKEVTKVPADHDLLTFVRRTVFSASAKALIGKNFDADAVFDDFFYFDDQSKLLIAGVPEYFLPKVVAARERVLNKIRDCKLEEAGELVKMRGEERVKTGEVDKIATDILGFLFASQTNSINGAFWTFLYILQHQDVLDKIGEEIMQFDPSNMKSIDKCETLDAAFYEMARIASATLSFREVVEETTVNVRGKDYILPKGHSIFMFPIDSFNRDYFPRPEEFKPDRQKLLTRDAKSSQIPFGGGMNICPGRHFAILEVKLFVIYMIRNFRIALEKGRVIEPSRMTVGVLPPTEGIRIYLQSKKKVIPNKTV